ncbi:MAG: hypothetical protein IJP30_02965 [Clostridia bacterium]|nr:hypothetical protein [Clostridia bacterium]
MHMKHLPELSKQAFASVREFVGEVRAIGVSQSPRTENDSYMPVFMQGKMLAQSLANALNVPCHFTSHQWGHIRAAEKGIENVPAEYLAVHLSGGTSEVLFVDRTNTTAELLGGTKDISAGQLLDRIGVLMGGPFPAGPWMEQLAMRSSGKAAPIGIPVSEIKMNLSGAEAEAKRRYERGETPEEIAGALFSGIARALIKLLMQAYERTDCHRVIMAGGVSASTHLRKEMLLLAQKRCKRLKIDFAQPKLAGDNAVGVALLAMEREKQRAE